MKFDSPSLPSLTVLANRTKVPALVERDRRRGQADPRERRRRPARPIATTADAARTGIADEARALARAARIAAAGGAGLGDAATRPLAARAPRHAAVDDSAAGRRRRAPSSR